MSVISLSIGDTINENSKSSFEKRTSMKQVQIEHTEEITMTY